MKRNRYILVAAALVVIPSGLMAADGEDVPVAPQPGVELDQPVFTDGTARPLHEPQFIGRGPSSGVSDPIVRFGWWGTQNSGAPRKTGEWQDLGASPFFDVDGMSSNGDRSVNYAVTGTDNESTYAGLNYFGPLVDVDVDYNRYLHRLDHDPLSDFRQLPDDPGTYIGRHEDRNNVGEDYAIRVQEFDAKFKGHLTENLKWRLNVWGMRKQGERQARAFSHDCSLNAPDRSCHILSQRQRIDWMTTEIEPVLEWNSGPVTVEYSRTMRSFGQSDDAVFRGGYSYPSEFIDTPSAGGRPLSNEPRQYNLVAENYTQIDRIKLGVDVTENTDLYALLYYGDTENKYRRIHRTFDGWDVRLSNRSIDGVTLVAYGKQFHENNQGPTTFPEEGIFLPGLVREDVRHPVDRDKTAVGAKARWKLGQRQYSSTGVALAGGYEYSEIDRAFVTFTGVQENVFIQPNTTSHLLYVGPEWRVSSALDTYVRYKMLNTRWPLFGFRENFEVEDPEEDKFDAAVNTNQPQHVDTVEFGGTWTPADNFLLSGHIGIEKRSHLSQYANFDEDNYPLVFTAWWAPTQRLSFSGGLAFYSNFIDQDITIGPDAELRGGGREGTQTTPWQYFGRADVYTLGANYAWTDRITLTGGLEYMRGSNGFRDPSTPELSLVYLPDASAVIVETWRFSAGIDYEVSARTSVYFRYVYYDYGDIADAYNTGTSNFFLGGFSAVF